MPDSQPYSLMSAQRSLTSFYTSVKFEYPNLAEEMRDDIEVIAINALLHDKSPGQPAANRLLEHSHVLPVIYIRVLESALIDLGYSLNPPPQGDAA